MAPSQTGTKRAQSDPRIPGISFDSSPARHRAPWKLTLYHNGTKTRTFHATLEDAIKAKAKAGRLQQREGSRAFAFDRKAHVEFDEAKRIVGDEVSLTAIAKEYAQRKAAGIERKSLVSAVGIYLESKKTIGRSYKHYQDIKERLSLFASCFSDRMIDSLKSTEILEWLLSFKKDGGLAARSVWNYYGAVTSLFKFAERRGWLESSPIKRIDPKSDLPAKIKGKVQVLSINAAEAFVRLIESDYPEYIAWACIQYFLGVRDAETEKFRGEWVRPKGKEVRIPGWFWHEEPADSETKEEAEAVAKTRDDWVIHDAPAAFWTWVRRYPEAFSEGPILCPSWKTWGRIRDGLIDDGHFKKWPHNGLRHSFATYHLSAYSDPGRTSLILRHQNSRKLYANYLAERVAAKKGLEYLSLRPKAS